MDTKRTKLAGSWVEYDHLWEFPTYLVLERSFVEDFTKSWSIRSAQLTRARANRGGDVSNGPAAAETATGDGKRLGPFCPSPSTVAATASVRI